MQPDLVPRGCCWGTAGIWGWSPARLACRQPGPEVVKTGPGGLRAWGGLQDHPSLTLSVLTVP